MCSNETDGDDKWITMDTLSNRNQEILDRLSVEDPLHYSKKGWIKLNCSSKEEAAQELQRLASVFEMQDVLEEGEAYDTVENYLVNKFGLGKAIPNPNKTVLEKPKRDDYPDEDSYMKAFRNWAFATPQSNRVLVFDESLMTKPFEEYLEEAGDSDLYDSERKVVYTSQFYKKMHDRYLEYVKREQQEDADIDTTRVRKTSDFDDDGDR